MEFFNKKEDVIDLELTPYGEAMLANGTFKPELYAFFDDEILYDGAYGGLESEAQNKIKERIKEVPRLKTQYLFTNTELPSLIPIMDDAGIMTSLPEFFDDEGEIAGTRNLQPVDYIKHYTLPWPLGNCSFDSDKAPSWDINLLYNRMDAQVGHFSSSMHPYLKIPQLDVTIQYETKAVMTLDTLPDTSEDNINKAENLRLKEFDELHESPPLYDDGYYDFQEDFIVLEINEHNVPFLKENFDIEVFEIVAEAVDQKYDFSMYPKLFTKKPTVVNEKGLLKSEEESIKSYEKDLEFKLLPLNHSFAEHFFNVYIDYEIDQDLMCKLKPSIKQKGFFVSDPLDCLKDNDVNILSSDIYKEANETTPECD